MIAWTRVSQRPSHTQCAQIDRQEPTAQHAANRCRGNNGKLTLSFGNRNSGLHLAFKDNTTVYTTIAQSGRFCLFFHFCFFQDRPVSGQSCRCVGRLCRYLPPVAAASVSHSRHARVAGCWLM